MGRNLKTYRITGRIKSPRIINARSECCDQTGRTINSQAMSSLKITSKIIILSASVCSLGGLLYGYDLAVVAGAILFIKQEFGLTSFLQEAVLSAALLGAVIGAGFGGILVDRLGREKILIASALISLIGIIGTALSPNATVLIISRVTVGIGFGVISFATPLYISEISSAQNRGILVSIFILSLMTGILISYVVDYLFSAYSQWRLMFAVGAVPAAALAVGMLYVPESPRWLVKNGHIDNARYELCRIRGTGEVDEELSGIENIVDRPKVRWTELLSPSLMPAFVLGLGLAVIRQLTGVTLATFYAPTIFRLAGFRSASTDLLETVVIGVVFVVMTLVAMKFIDRYGRRPLLLTGLACMCLGLLVLGTVLFFPSTDGGFLGWIAVGSLLFFVAGWSVGPGAVVQLILSEIYPLNIRGLAISIATLVIWLVYVIVTLTFLSLLQILGKSVVIWFYAVLCVLSILFVYFNMPETKGLSLEEIEEHWRSGKPARDMGK